MYHQHFGLRESPFSITPDTSFFYACRSIQEALNTLLIAVGSGEGFIKITGEVGTGKTLLCRKFLATLGAGWASAYVPNPSLEPRALVQAVAAELGVRADASVDQHQLLKGITLALLGHARHGKRVVICMDESQVMPLETLEMLRLLTNLETEKRKLLQVVLFGQPELDRKLASESIRQLRQRITFHYDLTGLDGKEIGAYVEHRLRKAGHAGAALFERGALAALHRASRGVPRLVNILAHKAMLLVYGEGGQLVMRRHVDAAAEDTPAAEAPSAWWWPRLRASRVSSD
ncbi:MAG TPA: AAA family ATPase [Burkholderiales bacterium]